MEIILGITRSSNLYVIGELDRANDSVKKVRKLDVVQNHEKPDQYKVMLKSFFDVAVPNGYITLTKEEMNLDLTEFQGWVACPENLEKEYHLSTRGIYVPGTDMSKIQKMLDNPNNGLMRR